MQFGKHVKGNRENARKPRQFVCLKGKIFGSSKKMDCDKKALGISFENF